MPAERPNIIFIIVEQARADTIRACSADWMHTPHLDALAAERDRQLGRQMMVARTRRCDETGRFVKQFIESGHIY